MSSYDLQSLNLPVLNGQPLKLFASAFENPVMRSLLKNNLLKNGGIMKLRQSHFTDVPTFIPLVKSGNPASTPMPLASLDPILKERGHELPYPRIRDYFVAYQEGKITPIDIAKNFLAALAQSEQLNPPLRAFIAVNEEDLLSQAEESTARWAAGKQLSILDGVPVTIKDEIDMIPFPSTAGTTYMGSCPVQQDATVVARLRAGGALLLGKANMHEIGINPDGSNAHYGRVCNPWNLNHDSGGSSSGPAASVAAGFSPISLGADGGGSIRVPAAHCGLFGIKPTYGRISEFGAAPIAWSVGTLGPIASSVEDLTIAYAAIAGPDDKGPRSVFQSAVSIEGWNTGDLNGIKVGIYWAYFNHAHEEIVSANKTLLSQFEDVGAEVVEIEIPELDNMRIAHALTILSEMAACMTRFPEHMSKVSPSTSLNLTLAREFTAEDYLKAQQIRTRALKFFGEIFQQVDVILTPTTAVTAPLVPDSGQEAGWSDLGLVTELMRYMFIANLTGFPAISFPAGYNSQGLPIGMQAMGNHWDENTLLRIAYTAEKIVEKRLPPIFYDLIKKQKRS